MTKKVSKKRVPPVGSSWRILAWSRPRGDPFSVYSKDYPAIDHQVGEQLDTRTVFDELVVDFPGGIIHLEQMSTRSWFLGIGEEKVMIHVDKDGVPRMGEWYR